MTPCQQQIRDALIDLGDGWADICAIACITEISSRRIQPHLAALVQAGSVTRRPWQGAPVMGRPRWQYRRAGAACEDTHACGGHSDECRQIPPHIETYLEAANDFHNWCSDRGLDFRGQMVEAMQQHIKDKDTKP